MSSRPIIAGDPGRPRALASKGTFRAITHGGVMEHLDSAESIRETLRAQLEHTPSVIFDIPLDSLKNRRLFARDTNFHQRWTAEQWLHDVLAGLTVVKSCIDRTKRTT